MTRPRAERVSKEPTILFCVGATKSGTSWLFDYLADHPECHVRSIKELHYFDTLESKAFRQQLVVQRNQMARLRDRLGMSKGTQHRRAADKMQDVLDWHNVLKERAENTANYLGYLTWGMDRHSLVADVTPAYALLPIKRLKQMAGLSKETRFIYVMRDPVARLWSHVRMLSRRVCDSADALASTCNVMMERVLQGQKSSMTERGDYEGAIRRLNAAVDPAKLLIMFMEELLTPAGVARVCAFLNIDYKAANFSQPVHVGVSVAMSPEHRDRARAYLRPQYEFVARHFSDLPENWRRNMGEARL
jgi:hypothetical protein